MLAGQKKHALGLVQADGTTVLRRRRHLTFGVLNVLLRDLGDVSQRTLDLTGFRDISQRHAIPLEKPHGFSENISVDVELTIELDCLGVHHSTNHLVDVFVALGFIHFGGQAEFLLVLNFLSVLRIDPKVVVLALWVPTRVFHDRIIRRLPVAQGTPAVEASSLVGVTLVEKTSIG